MGASRHSWYRPRKGIKPIHLAGIVRLPLDAAAESDMGEQKLLRIGELMYGSSSIASTLNSPLMCALGLSMAFLRLRAAISAKSFSVALRASIIACA